MADLSERGDLIAESAETYDPRHWPWFATAKHQTEPYWYNAYRYWIEAPDNAYDALGMGMAAPLYTSDGRFIGVLTADVALDKLNLLLETVAEGLGGVVFLYDQQNLLLASSSNEPSYHIRGDQFERVQVSQSTNELIRKANAVILQQETNRGRLFEKIGAETYLFDWWEQTLLGGLRIAIANMLPNSQFAQPAQDVFSRVLLYSLLVLGIFFLLALAVSRWVARPLDHLGDWAEQLNYEQWSELDEKPSPIREVNTLTRALNYMVGRVRHYTEHLKQEVLARTVELEQANQALEQRSNTDGLTQLANRRFFDETLKKELAVASRLGKPLALIMVDVDFFKLYNDCYGHLAGDECLQQVANTLRKQAQRPTDFVARYGGEEFAIIVSHSAPDNVLALAELLRGSVEALQLPHEKNKAGVVTISLGIGILYPSAEQPPQQLIALADRALYQAKEHGRNQISVLF